MLQTMECIHWLSLLLQSHKTDLNKRFCFQKNALQVFFWSLLVIYYFQMFFVVKTHKDKVHLLLKFKLYIYPKFVDNGLSEKC